MVFLLHIALDVPLAIQGLWSPLSLPFLQMTNTTLVFLKVRFDSETRATLRIYPRNRPSAALRRARCGNVCRVPSVLRASWSVYCLTRQI